MSQHKLIFTIVFGLAFSTAACRTLETGGKIVDKSRNEVLISSPGNQQTALPDGSQDTSIASARQNLEVVVKDNPRDINALLSLAQLQLAQDQFSDSEATCRRALLIDIKNLEARKVLAQVSIRIGDYAKARVFLASLGGEASTDSSVQNMLGLIAYNSGDNGEAMRIWKHSLTLNASDISVRMNMGVLYLKYRLLAQARAQFERILKVAPSHQDAKLHLAIIDASRGKNSEAMVTYQEILRSDRTNQLALYNLAVAQKNLNQPDESIASFKSFIKASPRKSEKTDQAFASIDEINAGKVARGEKASEGDVAALADELSNRKIGRTGDRFASPSVTSDSPVAAPAAKGDSAASVQGQAAASTVTKTRAVTAYNKKVDKVKEVEVKEVVPSDSEIDALENQLKAPAH
jgi:tetratricopeptide (TPR) repeat protein